MIKDLISLANDLDQKGLKKEADLLDSIIKRASDIISFPEGPRGSQKPRMTPGELVDFSQRKREKEIDDLLEAQMAKDEALKKRDKFVFILNDGSGNYDNWAEDALLFRVSQQTLNKLAKGESTQEVLDISRAISLADVMGGILNQ